MAEQQQRPQKHGSGFSRLFEQGVDTATRNNVTAYGYSITITAAFALLQTSCPDTGVLEIFIFAAGGVLAFALIAAVASGFFREELLFEEAYNYSQVGPDQEGFARLLQAAGRGLIHGWIVIHCANVRR